MPQPIAQTPEPPYTAVIFTAMRTELDEPGYQEMAAKMVSMGRQQPGYLGLESVRDHSGLGITVSYWSSAEAAKAWKAVADHLGAQQLGRDRWYSTYRTRVATVDRDYGFTASGN